MALDRQAVEKKDFPISRRGYEPEAVDAHLARLADELEQAERRAAQAEQRASRSASAPAPAQPTGARVTASLAQAASDQVRIIVEAAESSAAEIEGSALEDAERIRREAQLDASDTRQTAIGRSEEHVSRVGDATSQMLQRVDAMEGELGSLLDSLRTGTNRLNADLSLLQGQLGELHDRGASVTQAPPAPRRPAPTPVPEPVALEPEPAFELEPEPAFEPELEPEPEAVLEEEPELIVVDVVDEDEIVTTDGSGPVAAEDAATDDGESAVEGARLVALDMALNGQPREETDAYLRDNFELSDREGLLDEVYATVEG